MKIKGDKTLHIHLPYLCFSLPPPTHPSLYFSRLPSPSREADSWLLTPCESQQHTFHDNPPYSGKISSCCIWHRETERVRGWTQRTIKDRQESRIKRYPGWWRMQKMSSHFLMKVEKWVALFGVTLLTVIQDDKLSLHPINQTFLCIFFPSPLKRFKLQFNESGFATVWYCYTWVLHAQRL